MRLVSLTIWPSAPHPLPPARIMDALVTTAPSTAERPADARGQSRAARAGRAAGGGEPAPDGGVRDRRRLRRAAGTIQFAAATLGVCSSTASPCGR
ncbi:hypothetical protein AB5I41_28155 [Sphingomonas sp. MMS24-JH45]